MPIGARSDLFRVTLSVGGADFGVWEEKTGGTMDTDDLRYRLGGQDVQVSLGGPPTVEDVTIQKIYPDDAHQQIDQLRQARLNGTAVVVGIQAQDQRRAPFGPVLSYRGTIKSVSPADVNSNANDASQVTVVISVTGEPSVAGTQ